MDYKLKYKNVKENILLVSHSSEGQRMRGEADLEVTGSPAEYLILEAAVWQRKISKWRQLTAYDLVNSFVSILEYWANHHGTHTQNSIYKNLTIL
jgi:hypothetical protein